MQSISGILAKISVAYTSFDILLDGNKMQDQENNIIKVFFVQFDEGMRMRMKIKSADCGNVLKLQKFDDVFGGVRIVFPVKISENIEIYMDDVLQGTLTSDNFWTYSKGFRSIRENPPRS